MPSVLIVDDLISIHEMLDAVIQPTGFSTAFATDGEKALTRYKAEKFDLVLADIDMKPMDGITLLRHLKQYDPNSVTVIMTAYASTESAVQALKFGAFDYLQKPFRVDELISALRRGMELRTLQLQRSQAPVVVGSKPVEIESYLLGPSDAMRRVINQVRKLASVRTPVLLVGENGTGKTTVAQVFHLISGADEASFIGIDCALSTEENFREGLLGQNGEGGAWVKAAKGGTLFLQHLQCLSLPVQKELVSVLRNTAHGFRLVCTTNEDLEKMVDEGTFNDELFYRVASLPLHLPPLRDRHEDFPELIKFFAAHASNPLIDPNLMELTDDAMAVIYSYHWPGNLTELRQMISKVVSTTESRVITSAELPLRIQELESWPTLDEFTAGQQRQYADRVLRACRGDKVEAARVLGIDVSLLG